MNPAMPPGGSLPPISWETIGAMVSALAVGVYTFFKTYRNRQLIDQSQLHSENVGSRVETLEQKLERAQWRMDQLHDRLLNSQEQLHACEENSAMQRAEISRLNIELREVRRRLRLEPPE